MTDPTVPDRPPTAPKGAVTATVPTVPSPPIGGTVGAGTVSQPADDCTQPHRPQPNGDPAMPTAPHLRIACVADPDRRHAFYWAFYADYWDKLADAYTKQGLIFEPAEFTDQPTLDATAAWLADATRTADKPMLVLIGSTENGDWVGWNLSEIPLPDVPEPAASRARMRASGVGPVPAEERGRS